MILIWTAFGPYYIFPKMSLLGHEFIDSSNVDPENQDELTINDINEFVPVFNRRMKLTSKTSVLHTQTRRWTNKAKKGGF